MKSINEQRLVTALDEVKYLRGSSEISIDYRNSNRYRLLVNEAKGQTAYCFSTPIYNVDSGRLISLNFGTSEKGHSFRGSNSSITVCDNRCVLENHEGKVTVILESIPAIQDINDISKSKISVSPTWNGIKLSAHGSSLKFVLKAETEQHSIRFSPTCFSIMREKFRPLVSITALYVMDENGDISPVELKHRDQGDQTYEFEISHQVNNGVIFCEINMYEHKLLQDTTVESAHPGANNAFGAVGFIGTTALHGEQWLYSRPDFSRIPDFTPEQIERAFLHIPVLNNSLDNLDVFTPVARFCSFGSTWDKKEGVSSRKLTARNNGRYISVDLTEMLADRSRWKEGLIMKKAKGVNDFIAISTGDCCSAPQILEIRFK